jgi:Zn-dependent protease
MPTERAWLNRPHHGQKADMENGSFSLGRLGGIHLKVHWSAALIAVLVGGSLGSAIGVGPALLGTIGFLASIVLHEFGHALTARRFDVPTESIQLWALGGVARLSREAPSPKAEGWIAAAGPLTSIGVGIVSLAAWFVLGGGTTDTHYVSVLAWLAIINALLALFNLLPGAPLDGGRIVKAVRWRMHGNKYRAMREAGRAGSVIGWGLAGIGFALILREQSGIWLMITGLFIAMNAKVESAAADVAERLHGIKIRDLTWFGVASAGSDMDADSMLWDRRRLGHAGGVAVTDDEGRPQGIVLEDELWAIPAEQRPWVMLTQLMVPFDRIAQASPDEDLTSVLPRLNPRQPIVTVWHDGKLVGMVPPRKLHDRIAGAGARLGIAA